METVRVAPIWLALRADLRRKWRALLSLALLLGLAGAVVLTAAAGARRTDTAYPRLLNWANAAQLDVVPGALAPAYFAALPRLPQVAAMSSAIQYNLGLPTSGGGFPNTQLEAFASPDDTLGVSVDRVKILQGAMSDPGAANQVVIDPALAAMEHLRPGSALRMTGIPYNGAAEGAQPDLSLAFPLWFRVTGIALFDDQVVAVTTTNEQPRILLTPAFSRTGAANSIVYLPTAGLRLRSGASPASVAAQARTLAKPYPAVQPINTVNLADEVAATQRAIKPEAVALAVFAGLAGLISLAVLGQLLARQLALDAAEFPILRAVGMTRGSLLALALVRLAVVTVAGGAVAVAIAIAASPLMPIGSARLAEPDPGVEVNVALLAAGFAVIALLPLAVLAPAAWRAVRHALGAPGPLGVAEPAFGRTRPSLLAAALTSAGPVTSGVGVRMAFEAGRGRTAVPVRSALAGTVIALAALVAAAVFGASLVGLVGTPHRYGDNWDAEMNIGFAGIPGPFFAARVAPAIPAVTGYAAGAMGQVTVDGVLVPAIGVDSVRGDGYLTLLAGHAPTAADEIVLGAQTLRALHVKLGQTVRVTVTTAEGSAGSDVPRPMRVVGEAVFPDFGLPGFSDTDLGSGALVATSLLSETAQETGCVNGTTCYDFFLLRYRPGTDAGAADARLLTVVQHAGCPFSACMVTVNQRPGDIRNYAAVRDTPLVLAAVLALLAVGTLAHVLLTGVRRRRRDLAVLKTLGCTRSQVHGMVAWEASALAATALLAGIPLGVIAGRWAWAVFADATGVAGQATVDLPLVLLAIPVTLLLANVIAAWPGWTAARLRPATVLRAE
jgi:ABC-type antimicrobial peptide transport system permease subunit